MDTTPSPPSQPTNPTKDGDEVRPCITELLRTGYHPAELVLRVERIVDVPIPTTRLKTPRQPSSSSNDDEDGVHRSQPANRRAFRVFFTDGELVIQALLKSALHRFVLTGKLCEGAVVKVQDFEVKRARRVGGKAGEIIYLAVGWFENVRNRKNTGQAVKENRNEERTGQRKRKSISEESEGGHKPEPKRVKFELSEDKDERAASSADDFDDDDELDDFMSQVKNPEIGKEQVPDSEKLADSFGMGAESFSELTEYMEMEGLRGKEKEEKEESKGEASTARPPSSFSAPKADSQPQGNSQTQRRNNFFFSQPLRPIERPLNVLSLSELIYPYKPLPKRNYLCDVFAVISWVSPTVVKRQHMAPKRDLRILDPTIEQRRPRGLQVSVFADAAGFNPPVGTIALLRSLKTHEWDGVSLNAYEKDCLGREWFITGPEKLKGYDVTAMKAWWERREKEKEKERERDNDSENKTAGEAHP